ncbi:SDR family NAD(P)-dependent oxidoreductase [Actinomadura sediminis]|uniref:SDR family NAD(P)-dependent oxidoreductase n=1 Tax=Actinomadura sediminis TaxID=1038904 RepID=A0ABW3EIP9_9ACTN
MSGVVIIGAGPGIGRAVARRFARAGQPIALVARTDATLEAVAAAVDGVPVFTARADSSDEEALRGALDRTIAEMGVPDVAVYNAAVVRADALDELPARELLATYAVNVAGAAVAAAHLMPRMAERGGGTFIITGGMPAPKPSYATLSLGKAAVRTLVALLDQRYGPSGVHAATVTVDGPVAPGTAFDPDDIAEHYWRLHERPEREVLHTERSAHDIVTGLLTAWTEAFNERRAADLAAMFTADALFQGIGPGPLAGPGEIRGYYERVPEGTTADARVLRAARSPGGAVAAFADVAFSAPTGGTRVRLSLDLQLEDDTWRIRHYHAAIASPGEPSASAAS